jgi:peptidoglycan biosynthesis protein MviN/MurJ (putative lipid II flippase)
MAALRTDSADLGRRGSTLALIQAMQVGSGLIGQVLLLARWSPNEQTDLFLLLSSVPWLVSAVVLVTGLEMAFPAAYHQSLVVGGEQAARRLLAQVQRLSLGASLAAAGISGGIVAVAAKQSGLSAGLSLWMGAAMGFQVIPAALGGLWRGTLVARDELVRARLALLAGSLVTVGGYAVLPKPSALALPFIAACAVVIAAGVAGRGAASSALGRASPAPTNRRGQILHPEITPLLRSLVGLSAAAGLVHLQTIIERAAVQPLATGAVTALAVAGRGWEAVLGVIVAAAVLPVYPRWANYHAQGQIASMRDLLCWSLRRAMILSGLAAVGIGIAAWLIGPWLAHNLGWETGEQAARMALALLPRFVLVSGAQPLILKHYASGTPWYPVVGAALGLIVLVIGVLALVPRYDLTGFMLATTASAIPGWLVLIGYEMGSAS